MAMRTVYRIPETAYSVADDGRNLYLLYGSEDVVAIFTRMVTLVEVETAMRQDLEVRFARAPSLRRLVGDL